MTNSPGGIQHILIITAGAISNSHSSPGCRVAGLPVARRERLAGAEVGEGTVDDFG